MEGSGELLAAMMRAARLQAAREGTTATAIWEEILLGRFMSEGRNGRTVISTAANGATVQFQIPATLGPDAIMVLAHKALEHIETGGESAGPRPVSMLHASFTKATT